MRGEYQVNYICPKCSGTNKRCRMCKGKGLSLYQIRYLQPELSKAVYMTRSIKGTGRETIQVNRKLKRKGKLERIMGWIKNLLRRNDNG